MNKNKISFGWFKSAGFPFFFLAILALMSLSGCSSNDLSFTSEYQAVFLDNGQVFFGKLSDTNSAYFTLHDVYYVQTVKEKDKKELKNILIKRGNEWHNPAFMRINGRHVVIIEPVGENSRVAQLIREAEKALPPKSESSAPELAPKPESPPPASAPKAPESKSKAVPPRGR